MKIHNLTRDSQIYTSNAYLVTGNWNALSDINTLIDTGRDPDILEKIVEINTGVGKKGVEQVVLTHAHYDHCESLSVIIKRYNPLVMGYSRSMPDIDIYLSDGMALKIGDRKFEVIHIPGHSEDSVCLYCRREKILFAGDTPLCIRSADHTCSDDFIRAFSRIHDLEIETIYWGHGSPTLHGCRELIHNSWMNLKSPKYPSLETEYITVYKPHNSN